MKQTEFLNNLLGTFEVVASNVKGRHWLVAGRNFRSVHLVLDDVWKELLDGADKIAETIRVLKAIPISDLAEFIEYSGIAPEKAVGDSYSMILSTRDELNYLIGAIHNFKNFDPTTENDMLNITSALRHWILFLDGMIEDWTNPDENR